MLEFTNCMNHNFNNDVEMKLKKFLKSGVFF